MVTTDDIEKLIAECKKRQAAYQEAAYQALVEETKNLDLANLTAEQSIPIAAKMTCLMLGEPTDKHVAFVTDTFTKMTGSGSINELIDKAFPADPNPIPEATSL